MSTITVKDLRDGLPFGARISGITSAALADQAVRQEIADTFERRGVIVFEGVEPSTELQVQISNVFGPLKDHPSKTTTRVDAERWPGVIAISATPDMCIVEIDGKPRISWQPWHFDHCYNDELNRAGVLRAVTVAPDDGLTGFADGIQIWNDLPAEAKAVAADLNVIYTLDLLYPHQRFGLPASFKELRPYANAEQILRNAAALPRAIHPAVWTRETGEKVMHLSPYMAVGFEGQETPDGEEKFHYVWAEVLKVIRPYWHSWKTTDMLIWDNWRMLHEAGGCDPSLDRVMHRTTIKGDYGLGRFEGGVKVGATTSAM
ncbi:TauD/TfdA dioxygenase family protein [Pseudofrankia inefficax]|uniref:Taurine catabolism dioxygenase TauD/TfdA n=1 Tax=Pseudofrankia inefficax (strain DSM 45817 / CECT 9037 / DDB 130130 / EuI1c) TaxID=298654 RepID=E3J539_PSEI1|nr:TauD/TfdA family dioxygenase [Pseudofrankia inefficax]ADP79490.1 Taurine catabolism dioxygenase TauD/TfdA [Pseudofrankia inefficax]